jgi:hypothetical protein
VILIGLAISVLVFVAVVVGLVLYCKMSRKFQRLKEYKVVSINEDESGNSRLH